VRDDRERSCSALDEGAEGNVVEHLAEGIGLRLETDAGETDRRRSRR
jgi:hypothetical protein